MNRARLDLKAALRTCEMPDGFTVSSQDDIKEVHEKWRHLLVAARRAGNMERAADLSNAWALVKRQRDRWCPCGRMKSRGARLCATCLVLHKNGRAMGVPEFCVGVVSDGVLIESTKRSKLYDALNKLDAVGKSVVLDSKCETIRAAACKLGVKVKIYQMQDENGVKTKFFRVWRTDGLSIEDVNAAILKRNPGPIPKINGE